jgi:glycosyltransferase involved in cell wall biosynthesis
MVERAAGGLTVLWLGSVILRKGIAYLVEAARELAHEPVKFLVAGPIGISESALRQAPSNIQWLGAVPRSEAHRLYRGADVFVLPTLSDGFAITQVEALAHGVPVVATPNCGAVVNDGRTGFLVPARDARALAAALRRFIREPGLASRMRPACFADAARYTVAAYADRLESIIKVRRATQTVIRSS